jgi:hypothetical protein
MNKTKNSLLNQKSTTTLDTRSQAACSKDTNHGTPSSTLGTKQELSTTHQ